MSDGVGDQPGDELAVGSGLVGRLVLGSAPGRFAGCGA
jgi:hypothetical protein